MGIELSWDDAQQTILVARFDPEWAWGDLYEVATEVNRRTAAADHKIGYIIDLRATRMFPPGISSAKIKPAMDFSDPNAGLAIFVGTNLFLQTMATTVIRVMGRREDFMFIQDIEQARAILAERLKQDLDTA